MSCGSAFGMTAAWRWTLVLVFFFFNDTATTEIYTLSLHDALPISRRCRGREGASPTRRTSGRAAQFPGSRASTPRRPRQDRKSTRLNSSHSEISYAVFCLKKKIKKKMLIYSIDVY